LLSAATKSFAEARGTLSDSNCRWKSKIALIAT